MPMFYLIVVNGYVKGYNNDKLLGISIVIFNWLNICAEVSDLDLFQRKILPIEKK